MPVTNTLQRVSTVAQILIRNAPLTFPALAAPNDLVLLAGDWVRQFILSPPFAWRWNRSVTSFATNAGQQDYTLNVTTFGWLEKAVLQDTNSVAELVNRLNLGEDVVQSQPQFISARLDNNNGQITFRLLPVPDKSYTVNLTYQNSAPTFGALTDTWAPIPDYLSYLYQSGFNARAYEYFLDERFGSSMQLFVRQLVGASEGLDETQKNIFLGMRTDTSREEQASQMSGQFGNQGRFVG